MSVIVIKESTPVARKDYDCMACDYLMNAGMNTQHDLTPDEWQYYQKAKENKVKVIKGQKYVRQTNKYDGDIYTFTAIPEIHKICLKYDLYEE